MKTPLQVGQTVRIVIPEGHDLLTTTWWPRGENTGTVQKLFKNGKVAVAVHRLRNRSEDGFTTINFSRDHLEEVSQ